MVEAMRLGVISDIHGNLPALEAVLEAMPSVDLLLCAGDLVGYYPDVNEVCDRMRQSGAAIIRGNHDAYVTGELRPDPSRALAYRTEWTRQCLTAKNHAWLAALPVELRFSFGAAGIRMRHASPWDEETYLYKDSPKLKSIHPGAGEFVISGHTHIPLCLRMDQGFWINPGSVGQPRDFDPRASFSTIDTVTEAVEIIRCSYPVEAYQDRLREMNWDAKMVQILSRNAG
jgi:predicted phosphodiesterase